MFGNFKIADIIAYYFMKIDIKCREDLQNGLIVSERDYVSTFATRVRDKIFPHFECVCQTLTQSVEHQNGVDGIIVFKYKDLVKVGMFEAKRPQIKLDDYGWDYLSSRGISHFTEQIENQRKWKNAFALWEVFFNEAPDGYLTPPFESQGSSCVWNNKAYSFANKESLYPNNWTTEKLKKLLESDGINLYSIIYEIISCKQGKLFTVSPSGNTAIVINPADNQMRMEIPIPTNITRENDPIITAFLKSQNLESYTYVNLEEKLVQIK